MRDTSLGAANSLRSDQHNSPNANNTTNCSGSAGHYTRPMHSKSYGSRTPQPCRSGRAGFRGHVMPNTDKNKDGGHSHPQKSNENHNAQGDSRKSSAPADSGKKGSEPKESFGSSGAKDSH
jgi:hypothetical protein